MKTPRSWPSVALLQERIDAWMLRRTGQRPWYPGRWGSPGLPDAGQKVVDVVLFGDFFEVLARRKSWPGQQCRLWVVSTATERACRELFGLEGVGVIPRDEIFPPRKARAFPRAGQKLSWVYAGRLSHSKNFRLTVRVVSILQSQMGIDAPLVCYGATDPFRREDFGDAPEAFDGELGRLIRELPWTRKPLFRGRLSPTEWVRERVASPVLLNLSTYCMEDFGVSVAQAQEAGWPCVLSDWGGHQDVTGPGVLRIPAAMVGFGKDSESVEVARAQAIAAEIERALLRKRATAVQGPSERSWVPRPIDASELARIRKKASRGGSARHIFRWARTAGGARFFEGLRAAYEASPGRVPATIAVLSPWHPMRWLSMQEIVPAIETSWIAASRVRTGVASVIRPGKEVWNRHSEELVRARLWVLSFPDPAILELLKILRHRLGLRTPIVFHTHGEGTSAMASYQAILPHLRQGDLFVCACQAEARALRLSLPKARTSVIPFAVAAPSRKPRRAGRARELVYVGRISEQKNLPTVLLALRRLRDSGVNAKLHVFGAVDGLGSPNMAMASRSYGAFVRRLSRTLGLGSAVVWHGRRDREFVAGWIERRDCVFVSASLHSDEDFGMAAVRALLQGRSAVLSAWGGHWDFQRSFGETVRLVPVHGSPFGPWISPIELAEALRRTLRGHSGARFKGAPYALATISAALAALAENDFSRGRGRLALSPGAARAQERLHRGLPLFQDYSEPFALQAFQAYGMRGRASATPRKDGEYLLVPWLRIEDDQLVVGDPHRGERKLVLSARDWRRVHPRAIGFDGKPLRIPLRGLAWLLRNGDAFQRPRR